MTYRCAGLRDRLLAELKAGRQADMPESPTAPVAG